MKKAWINFWLGATMFISVTLLGATGLIMRFVVPAGQGKGQSFLSLARHSWRDIHFTLALIFLSLLAVHLVLHWNWIVGRFRDLKKRGKGPDPECSAKES